MALTSEIKQTILQNSINEFEQRRFAATMSAAICKEVADNNGMEQAEKAANDWLRRQNAAEKLLSALKTEPA